MAGAATPAKHAPSAEREKTTHPQKAMHNLLGLLVSIFGALLLLGALVVTPPSVPPAPPSMKPPRQRALPAEMAAASSTELVSRTIFGGGGEVGSIPIPGKRKGFTGLVADKAKEYSGKAKEYSDKAKEYSKELVAEAKQAIKKVNLPA